MDKIKITREHLYDLVWSKPMTHIAKDYGISDVAVRKICKKLNIPMPHAGYWAKVRSGQKVKVENLPAATETTLPVYELNPEVEKVKILKAPADQKVTVPEHLVRPHPLIELTERYFRDPKSIKWSEVLNIQVSKQNERRALRIFDTIIKEIEERGGKVKVDSNSRTTLAVFDGIEIKIRLRELQKMVKVKDPNPIWGHKVEWHYSELLALEIDSWFTSDPIRRNYKDGEKFKLEDWVSDFIFNLFRGFALKKEWNRQAEIAEQERRKREEIEREEKRKREIEEKKIEIFSKLVQQKDKVEAMTRFIAAVRENFTNEIESNSQLSSWLLWAEGVIAKLNPLKSLSFLNEFEVKVEKTYW